MGRRVDIKPGVLRCIGSAMLVGAFVITATTVALGGPLPLTPSAPAMHSIPDADAKVAAVKVGFLYNFTKLVQWPSKAFASSSAPFEIVVLGRRSAGGAPLESVLEATLARKSVGSRPIVIRRVSRLDQVKNAHIVYVGASFAKSASSISATLAKRPTLVVSSIPSFAESGGMVGFSVTSGKLKFAINRTVATRAGLEPSSKLLALATLVETKAGH